MSSGGPSWLNYSKGKICPKCGSLTRIRLSRSFRNPNKQYYWCNKHRFVDWCLPTNVEAVNPNVCEGIKEEKGDPDFRISVKNRFFEINASCKGNSIPSLLCIAVVVALVSVCVVFTLKVNAII